MSRLLGTDTSSSTWSVYVLECADGSYYTGVTNDLARRLDTHRAGKASKYTRGRLPVRLACTLGAWPTCGPALKLEARIKAMTRLQKRELIRHTAHRRSGVWRAIAAKS